jgi:hypothetical protein
MISDDVEGEAILAAPVVEENLSKIFGSEGHCAR